MKRFLYFIFEQFAAFASNVSDLIEVVIDFPRAVLGGQGQSSLLGRALLFLFQLVWFPIYAVGWLILAPLRLLTDFSAQRRTDFLFGLPALFVATFVGAVSIYVNVQADQIEKRYREVGQKYMLEKDYAKAKTYLGRVVANQSGEAKNADVFNWFQILSQTGEPDRARAILDKLAPFEKVGYHKAHQFKAMMLAQQLNQSNDPLVLKKLRWHLENSREESVVTNQAWAVFYRAIGESKKAIEYLEKAAVVNPSNLIDIAKIHGQAGDQSARKDAMERAESRFRKLLEKDQLDSSNRIKLADALVQLDKVDEAEQVLATGLKLQPDKLILRAAADFFVMRHDRARAADAPFSDQLNYLRQAMKLDINYSPIYDRLLRFYQFKYDNADLSKVKEAVMSSVASNQPTALAHLALSNIMLLEKDNQKAEWHLEQAYQLEPTFVIVLNNLAWTLAHKDDPDLERAFNLSKTVVERSPNDPRFRDTYATVLMKQGKHEQAVVEFEKTLPTIKNKKPIHEKLAFLYREIGRNDLAQRHAQQAEGVD